MRFLDQDIINLIIYQIKISTEGERVEIFYALKSFCSLRLKISQQQHPRAKSVFHTYFFTIIAPLTNKRRVRIARTLPR